MDSKLMVAAKVLGTLVVLGIALFAVAWVTILVGNVVYLTWTGWTFSTIFILLFVGLTDILALAGAVKLVRKIWRQ